jgi:ankyrin repeat protein
MEAKHMRVTNPAAWLLPAVVLMTLAASGEELRLVDAVKARNKTMIRALLKQRPDVNAPQLDGTTALHWAAHWGDLQTAQLLIAAGAKVDAVNRLGVMPLSLACVNGDAVMVDALVKGGANTKAALPTGETVLMTCARSGNAAAVTTLLTHGADANAHETERGQNALMWAAAENHPDVVRALIEHGADVNARSAKVAGTTVSASTPILFAARNNAADAIRVLLEKGANINDAASDGLSVLLTTMHQGYWELSHTLLALGADPNIASAGYTPLHWICGTWETDLNGMLGVRPDHYKRMAAVGRGKLELVKDLLAHGADPNVHTRKTPPRYGYTFAGGGGTRMDWRGATPFILAAHSGEIAVMRALLDAGADPLAKSADHTTALIAAAGYGRTVGETHTSESAGLESTKLALEVGNDVNAANDLGDTPLHGAAYWGKDTIVQFLVDHGAQVNALNKAGASPLQLAEGHSGAGTGGNTYSWPSTAALLRKLGGSDVVEIVAEVDNLSTPCPQPVINFKKAVGMVDPSTGGNSRGIGIETNASTRYAGLTCEDVRPGTRIKIKGVREIEKGWNGLVMASDIALAQEPPADQKAR